MNAAIIGAGIHGASAALALARRGHDVTIFERDVPASKLGSSHGRSRIVRLAYPDSFYTEIMAEGYPMWRDLETEAGERLLHETGLLYFGLEASPTLAQVAEGLRAVGDPLALVNSGDPRTGSIRLGAGEVGVYSPRAGWAHAERSVIATVALAQRYGAELRTGQSVDPAELAQQFDVVIVTSGAEIRRWFPEHFEVKVQTLAYFSLSHQGPVFIEDSGDFFYGFPEAPGETGTKIGVHNVGTAWDLAGPRPPADPEAIDRMAQFVSQRFNHPNPEVLDTVTCLYTMTPDEDFRWGWLGKNVLWVSACSGHGFKFGPWIGAKCADFAEGIDEAQRYTRFFRNWKPSGAYNG